MKNKIDFKEDPTHNSKSGVIYILRNKAFKDNWLKIGRSKNSGDKRATDLNRESSTGLPAKHFCDFEYPTLDCHSAETAVFKTLRLYRAGHQEFFEVEMKYAIKVIIRECQAIDDNLIRQGFIRPPTQEPIAFPSNVPEPEPELESTPTPANNIAIKPNTQNKIPLKTYYLFLTSFLILASIFIYQKHSVAVNNYMSNNDADILQRVKVSLPKKITSAETLEERTTEIAEQSLIHYPYLNSPDGDATRKLITLERDSLIQSGLPPDIALREAVRIIAPMYQPK